MDDVLSALLRDAEDDPDTLAVILHGSRGAGIADDASDYDVVFIRTRKDLPPLPDRVEADVTLLEELRTSEPTWKTDGLVQGRLLLDKTGEVRTILDRLGKAPREDAAEAYDGYLNAFVRGIRAADRGDELGQRLNAAWSLMYLARALFALESRRAPFHDRLFLHLDPEWREPMLEILRTADVAQQRRLQARVEALMEERGVLVHREWGAGLARAQGQ
jgi:hypothetical protein